MTKYSVLMSLYIKEKPEYLDMALDSMVNQTVKPDEIVVVKDGEITPQLNEVLCRYEIDYPGLFNIVGYEKNRGLGLALNYGLKYCRNELVARMDTDDISRLDRCETQLKYFEKYPETDVVSGDIAEFIDTKENTVGYRKVPVLHNEIVDYMKVRCPLNHVATMYKKSAVTEAGSYKDWFWNEDYYLWIRMFEKKCHFGNTGTVLVDVRTGTDMYNRRGGMKYFKSEIGLQKYMFKNKIISFPTFVLNYCKRLIVQILIPNSMRGWIFRNFARDKEK